MSVLYGCAAATAQPPRWIDGGEGGLAAAARDGTPGQAALVQPRGARRARGGSCISSTVARAHALDGACCENSTYRLTHTHSRRGELLPKPAPTKPRGLGLPLVRLLVGLRGDVRVWLMAVVRVLLRPSELICPLFT